MAKHPKAKRTSAKPPSRGNMTADPEIQHEQEALARQPEGLVGDTAQNRNLTGSTTWETLPDPAKRTKNNQSGTNRSSGPPVR